MGAGFPSEIRPSLHLVKATEIMSTALKLPTEKMTADQFMAWSARTPGRFELVSGDVHIMQSERVEHAEVKFRVQRELELAIKRAKIDCRMLPDGMSVRTSADDVFEPDALVYCGPKLPRGAIEVPNPMIIVEVGSPSTSYKDHTYTMMAYLQLPSLQHYILIDPLKMSLVHHARQSDATFLTRLVSTGMITMSPPGISIPVENLLD